MVTYIARRSPPGLAAFRSTLAWASLAATMLVTASCMVGPDYKRPPVDVPGSYKESPPAGSEAGSVWQTAQPRDDVLRGKWWEAFGDPQLNALEDQVTSSNQDIAAEVARFRAARAAIRGVRADLFPTVTGSASVGGSRTSQNRSGARQGTSPVTAADYQLAVDTTYEVDAWGRVRRGVEASVADAQATAADLETVKLSIHAELALDYFALRGLDSEQQLLQTTAAANEKALQLTITRHDQGIASGLDVAQAETQLDTTRAQATDLGVTRAQFEHAIAVLAGKPPAELAITPAPIGGTPPQVPISLPSTLLERRPDVAAAERRMASANAGIGVARAAYFPAVALTASGGLDSSKLATLFSGPSAFWSLGAALVQTAFEGGRRRAATEQAQAAYDAAVAAYRQQVLSAFEDVEDNLAALRVLAEEAKEQDDAVKAAERSLALANSRYQGGIATYLEVIVAQAAALANERTAVEILTRRMTASVLLIKAVGGGWSVADLPSVRDLTAGQPH